MNSDCNCSHTIVEVISNRVNGPSTGDLCICFNCAEKLVFTDALDLRTVTSEDISHIDPRVVGEFLLAEEQIASRIAVINFIKKRLA